MFSQETFMKEKKTMKKNQTLNSKTKFKLVMKLTACQQNTSNYISKSYFIYIRRIRANSGRNDFGRENQTLERFSVMTLCENDLKFRCTSINFNK